MAEVLSRPTIMVENNEEANITIGNQVPIARGVSVSDSGQTNTQVDYQNVGIILDVIPHINPDGFVNLEVKPEISSLSASSVSFSEGFSAPIISERSAETVVTVKDGETVVIGGLIETNESESETKVPIMGDIPLIGPLFRATTVNSRRTELLIVLTVDVIRAEDDAYALSVKLRDQSGIMPERMKRNPLMQGLRITREEEEYGLGPADDGVQQTPRQPKDEPSDRQLYGPSPDVYGPKAPSHQPVQISHKTEDVNPVPQSSVYGPVLVSHETVVASDPNAGK
jgi:type II secretory pathway component GspD/PulD (secretin)